MKIAGASCSRRRYPLLGRHSELHTALDHNCRDLIQPITTTEFFPPAQCPDSSSPLLADQWRGIRHRRPTVVDGTCREHWCHSHCHGRLPRRMPTPCGRAAGCEDWPVSVLPRMNKDTQFLEDKLRQVQEPHVRPSTRWSSTGDGKAG